MIERWTRFGLSGRVIVPRAHEHYDDTRDKRWVCRRDPCLSHDVAPMEEAATMPPGYTPLPEGLEISGADCEIKNCTVYPHRPEGSSK